MMTSLIVTSSDNRTQYLLDLNYAAAIGQLFILLLQLHQTQ